MIQDLLISITLLPLGLFSDDGHLEKMLARNHKLNRGYVEHLNKISGSVYSGHPVKRKSKKEKLFIFYPHVGDSKHLNPDAIELRYEYDKFNYGKLMPVIYIPLNSKFYH